jgi:tRNA A-37 threonylcarbamoyl transferase component Bud32
MLTCQFCGENNPVGASFCDKCGGALTSAVAAQASAQASAQVQAAQATAKQQAVRVTATPHAGTGRLPPRTLLGKRYLIVKTVGKGGMAAVYQATDIRSNRVVALKEMSQESLSPEELREALESFAAEARLLKSLNHDNLPKVYDSFSENSRHYLAMEFIEGQTLEQRLADAHAPLPEAEVLRWAAQLCAALTYLHTRKPPIIFRDLKPANIMLTPQGKIKLVDFGIARFFSPNRKRDTQALGTPGYAPPEQYGSAQTDARADIYALGATLYQLLTNYDVSKTPFALPPMQSRNPRVSPHVRLAIERATRLDRNQRYATIADFQRDLFNPAGLYLQSGALARAPEEALALLAAQPLDGAEALYAGRVADWMTRWKRRDLADAATRAVQANYDRAAGLRAFLASPAAAGARSRAQATFNTARPTPNASANGRGPVGPGAQPGQRGGGLAPLVGAAASAASAGVLAAVTAGVKARVSGQPGAAAADVLKAGVKAAATTFASAAVGSTTLPTVQPRELDLGRVIAGQDASGALTISGQSGPVTGSVKALSPWIVVDKQQFNGQSTLITVTARTSAITGRGPQNGTIELAMANQRMYIPVRVDVAPVAPPPPAPPPRQAPSPAPGANAAAQAGKGATVAQSPVRPAAAKPKRNVRVGRVMGYTGRDTSGVRFALSVIVSLALAISLPWALYTFLDPWLASYISSDLTRALALLGISVLGALGGALAPYIGGRRSPGRARTAILGAIIGGALAFNLANQLALVPTEAAEVVFPEIPQVGPLAVTLPVLVAIGAALGAQELISRGILAVVRAIGARHGIMLVTSAILGGWLGLTITQAAINAAFHPEPLLLTFLSGCGLLLGVAIGLSLAPPIGAIARRFAWVRP